MKYQQRPRRYQSRLGAFNIITVLNYLKLLRKELSSNVVFRKGPIRFKEGHLKYLSWLVHKGLITKREDFHVVILDAEVIRCQRIVRKKPHVFYKTTAKGIKLLEMLE